MIDMKIKELIAIGASVSANCQSCLKYHVKKAIDSGISREMIKQAVDVGRMVGKGAANQMNETISEIMEQE